VSLVIAPGTCLPYLNYKYVRSYYPGFPKYTEECTGKNIRTLNWLRDNPEVKVVIMAAAWSGHIRMLYTSAETTNKSDENLSQKNAEIGSSLSMKALDMLLSDLKDRSIILLGDMPRPNKILNECAASETSFLIRARCDESDYRFLDADEIIAWHSNSDNVLRIMSEKYKNVRTIIPSDSLCNNDRCQTYINDELIYKDSNHLRRNINAKTAEELSRIIGLRGEFSLIWRN
jgi:hypothetical protein